MLLSQSMMEYGMMDAFAAGVTKAGNLVQSALADPGSRTAIIVVGAILGFWLLRCK
jgi:hypothetical protein